MKWKIAGKRDLQRINFSNRKTLFACFFTFPKENLFSEKYRKSIRKMIHWRELQCNKVLKHEEEVSIQFSSLLFIIAASSSSFSKKNFLLEKNGKYHSEKKKLPISFIEFYSKFSRVWYDVKTTNAWSNIIIVSFLFSLPFHCATAVFL